MWIPINKSVLGYQLIAGGTYIPHENSEYHDPDMSDDIVNDCAFLKSRYNDALICIVGDFNARAGTLNDFLDSEEFTTNENVTGTLYNVLNSKADLDLLDICTSRYNQDHKPLITMVGNLLRCVKM